jgi:hypothetical protein
MTDASGLSEDIMHRSLGLHALAIVVAALAIGCSFSDSSKSISNSISSPFKSSSESSNGGSDPAPSAYLRDVEASSFAHAGAGGDPQGLLREIGRVALAHGISDWESVPATYLAIGAGLRRAGLDVEAARRQADALFGAGTPEARSVLQGWHA